MPGEPEERREADRRKNGIDVDDATIEQLMQTAAAFGLDTTALGDILVSV